MQKAAKKLCQGIDGDQAAWDKGAAALDAMAAPQPDNADCWSSKAYDVLRAVAAFRRQNPDVKIKLAAGSRPACEPTLESLQDDPGNQPPDLACAGDAVVLVGRLSGLPAVAIHMVNVAKTTAVVQYRKGADENAPFPIGDFYFKAPSLVPGEPSSVDVTIADADWTVTGAVSLEYAAEQSACPGAVPPGAPAAPGSIP
jgi:hypothetical protein